MDNCLYNKFITCPVCAKYTEITKVKLKACRVESRDTDFCVRYSATNPLLYQPIVCESCGYASLESKFDDVTDKEVALVKEHIKPRWIKRKFVGERDYKQALQAFKLVLYNLQVRNAKKSELAKVCLRIAWMYRFMESDKELEFLKCAFEYYKESYENERFPIDKLDEVTCMYILGELALRIEYLDESAMWFSKLISFPGAKEAKQLLEQTREQYQVVKKKMSEKNDKKVRVEQPI